MERCIDYRSYLISENHDLSHAIAVSHGGSTVSAAEKHLLSVDRGLDEQGGGSIEQLHTKCGSRRSSKSKRRDSELSMSMLETRNISENE